MLYETYLFDFDGTLVDSMPAFVSVMQRILDENHIPYGDDLVKIITPLGYAGTAKYFQSLGLSLPLEEILKCMQKYANDEYVYRIPAKPEVTDTLKALKARGASLHILTASPHTMLDPCLARIGIEDLFDNVWSCDDFGTTKANPEIYRMAAARIGVDVQSVLFLDDNFNADKTAKEAGMQVCGVFDPTSEAYKAEIMAVSDHYIHSFSELLNLESGKE